MFQFKDKKRFWSKVQKTRKGCWIFLGGKNKDGYGQFTIKFKTYLAHRFSFALKQGKIPKGMLVCHTCDTPACVRPLHLFLGDNFDNMQDAARKGRMPRGVEHCNSKLLPETVKEIKWRKEHEGITNKQLALEYHVYPNTIRSILIGKTWAWLS